MAFITPLNPPISQWHNKRVWLVGASTGIGEALAVALSRAGAQVIASARDAKKLNALSSAHANIYPLPLDATSAPSVQSAYRQLTQYLDGAALDVVCYCAGTYQAQNAAAFDLGVMQQHYAINYQGALHVLGFVLPTLLTQGSGHLSLVGSVAGYHGLPKALAYGPTKAALINLAQCLYLDLHPRGLGVSLINPGFVQTPLTAQNTFTMPALITPEVAAQQIMRGWEGGLFEIHFPKRFTLWLKVLSLLPARIAFAFLKKL